MLPPEFFERALDPRRLLELSERNPEAAMAMLQLVREFAGEHFRKDFNLERFEAAFSNPLAARLLREKPASFAVMLRLVSGCEQSDVVTQVLASLSSALLWRGAGTSVLEQLPLSALPDIQWFADRSGDDQVRRLVCNWLHKNGLSQPT